MTTLTINFTPTQQKKIIALVESCFIDEVKFSIFAEKVEKLAPKKITQKIGVAAKTMPLFRVESLLKDIIDNPQNLEQLIVQFILEYEIEYASKFFKKSPISASNVSLLSKECKHLGCKSDVVALSILSSISKIDSNYDRSIELELSKLLDEFSHLKPAPRYRSLASLKDTSNDIDKIQEVSKQIVQLVVECKISFLKAVQESLKQYGLTVDDTHWSPQDVTTSWDRTSKKSHEELRDEMLEATRYEYLSIFLHSKDISTLDLVEALVANNSSNILFIALLEIKDEKVVREWCHSLLSKYEIIKENAQTCIDNYNIERDLRVDKYINDDDMEKEEMEEEEDRAERFLAVPLPSKNVLDVMNHKTIIVALKKYLLAPHGIKPPSLKRIRSFEAAMSAKDINQNPIIRTARRDIEVLAESTIYKLSSRERRELFKKLYPFKEVFEMSTQIGRIKRIFEFSRAEGRIVSSKAAKYTNLSRGLLSSIDNYRVSSSYKFEQSLKKQEERETIDLESIYPFRKLSLVEDDDNDDGVTEQIVSKFINSININDERVELAKLLEEMKKLDLSLHKILLYLAELKVLTSTAFGWWTPSKFTLCDIESENILEEGDRSFESVFHSLCVSLEVDKEGTLKLWRAWTVLVNHHFYFYKVSLVSKLFPKFYRQRSKFTPISASNIEIVWLLETHGTKFEPPLVLSLVSRLKQTDKEMYQNIEESLVDKDIDELSSAMTQLFPDKNLLLVRRIVQNKLDEIEDFVSNEEFIQFLLMSIDQSPEWIEEEIESLAPVDEEYVKEGLVALQNKDFEALIQAFINQLPGLNRDKLSELLRSLIGELRTMERREWLIRVNNKILMMLGLTSSTSLELLGEHLSKTHQKNLLMKPSLKAKRVPEEFLRQGLEAIRQRKSDSLFELYYHHFPSLETDFLHSILMEFSSLLCNEDTSVEWLRETFSIIDEVNTLRFISKSKSKVKEDSQRLISSFKKTMEALKKRLETYLKQVFLLPSGSLDSKVSSIDFFKEDEDEDDDDAAKVTTSSSYQGPEDCLMFTPQDFWKLAVGQLQSKSPTAFSSVKRDRDRNRFKIVKYEDGIDEFERDDNF